MNLLKYTKRLFSVKLQAPPKRKFPMNCSLKFDGHHSKSQVLEKPWTIITVGEMLNVPPSSSIWCTAPVIAWSMRSHCASASEIVCAVFTTLHRVNRPITHCLHMTELSGRSFSILLYSEWFKMLQERLLKLSKPSLKCKAKWPVQTKK